MSHLDDEALGAAARAGGAGEPASQALRGGGSVPASSVAAHLASCPRCARRLDALARMSAAVRQVDQEVVALVVAPPFDLAIAPRLAALENDQRAAAAPVAPPRQQGDPVAGVVPAAGLWASWALAGAVLVGQRRLLPGVALGAMTLVGLVAAAVLALAVPSGAGSRLFAAAVALVVLVGAGAVCSPRWDPRRELLAAMPISPVAVFGCRLTLVLGAEVLAALAASVLAAALGMPLGLGALVLGWLGPALLAAAALVVVSVWRSARLGAVVGSLVWLLGVAGAAAASSQRAVGLGAVLAPLGATTGWSLALAAALMIAALGRVAAPSSTRTA